MPLEGFENAPVTKAILFSTIGSFLIQSYAAASTSSLRVETSKIVLNQEYWRFLSSQLTFQSSGELMVALPLMYMFRQFERHLGSRKFALHVLTSIFFSCTLQMCALYVVVFEREKAIFFYNSFILHMKIADILKHSNFTCSNAATSCLHSRMSHLVRTHLFLPCFQSTTCMFRNYFQRCFLCSD